MLGWGAAAFWSARTYHDLLLIQASPQAQPISSGPRVGLYHFGLKVGETDEELRAAIVQPRAAAVPIMGMSDHTVTHSVCIGDPVGNEIGLYIDVQPAVWRNDPEAFLAPVRPLRL